jgi:hypothetical protein
MSIIIPFSKGLADVILVRATSNVFFVPEKISLLLVRIKCRVSNGLSLFSVAASKFPNQLENAGQKMQII